MVAILHFARSEREFAPTPGMLREHAARIRDERIRHERLIEEERIRKMAIENKQTPEQISRDRIEFRLFYDWAFRQCEHGTINGNCEYCKHNEPTCKHGKPVMKCEPCKADAAARKTASPARGSLLSIAME